MTKAQRTALYDILDRAEARGREAFAEGKKPAPFYDMNAITPLIREATETTTVKPSIKVMDAWSRGWHKANLAQPIPEMPEWKSVWAQ